MTLSRTDLLTDIKPTPAGGFGTGDYTSGSFTPPSSSLLVVAGGLIEANGATTDPTTDFTISGGSLTWTQRVAQVVTPTAYPTLVKIWTAPVASGSSMTATFSSNGRNIGFFAISAVAFTGYDQTTPVGATGSGSFNGVSSGASPITGSLTLTGAPAAASEVFAVVGVSRDTAGVTPGASFTEIHDASQGTYGGMETQSRTGSASTTVDWADLRPGGGTLFNWAAAAAEVRAAAVPSWTYGYDVRIG